MVALPFELLLIADAPTAGSTDRLVEIVARAVAAAPGGRLAVVDRDLPPGLGGSPDRERLDRLLRLRELTSAGGSRLYVNGRVDLAVLAGADGVQLPERALDAGIVRAAFPGLEVGRSCHDQPGSVAAAAAGASWVVVAPVFAPISHKPGGFGSPLGLDGLASITAVCPIPVVALGGVSPGAVPEMINAGAAGVASRPGGR